MSTEIPCRADIAELLYAGHADAEVARQLTINIQTVRKARATLGLPRHRGGRTSVGSLEERYWGYAIPVPGGHRKWCGPLGERDVPIIRHRKRAHPARRIAFRIQHGREPVGNVRADCDYTACVAPGCVKDQAMREESP